MFDEFSTIDNILDKNYSPAKKSGKDFVEPEDAVRVDQDSNIVAWDEPRNDSAQQRHGAKPDNEFRLLLGVPTIPQSSHKIIGDNLVSELTRNIAITIPATLENTKIQELINLEESEKVSN